MIVLLNPTANGGRAREHWEAIRPALEHGLLAPGYLLVTSAEGLRERVLSDRDRVVVAAGGDGTVNRVLEAVMAMPEDARRDVTVGALGLGSSNDFHKPAAPERSVAGVPFRLDATARRPHNVGRVDVDDDAGHRERRHFLLNASVGIVSIGNERFNRRGPWLDALKRRAVSAAIWYATLWTLISTRNVPSTFRFGDERLDVALTNASFVIEPHFTGSLAYDLTVDPGGDTLAVAIAAGMGLRARIRTLRALAHGHFAGLPGTLVRRTAEVAVGLGRAVPLEVDGEVTRARSFRVTLLRKAVFLCS